MLVSTVLISRNHSITSLISFTKKTVQIREQFFLYMDPGSCAVLRQPLRGAPTQPNLELHRQTLLGGT
jgi:hypothetical protein